MAGKTVLVTGGNRGIGAALVDEALRRGAKRVYAGVRQPLTHPDSRVVPVLLDVTDREQVRAAVETVGGALDLLVNNAGLALHDDLTDREALQQHLAVNLFGTFDVTEAFLPSLVRSRGALVNVLSIAALAALPILPAYSVSKGAAFSLSQSLRALLAGKGVRVHAVLTGPVDTDMIRDLDIPKASPASVATAIFDGVDNGEEEIFPDLMSQSMAEAWRSGSVKAMERQNAAFVTGPDFTMTFTVDNTPQEAFAAINNVRGWWSEEVVGETTRLGDTFTFEVPGVHRTSQTLTEVIPDRKVVWHVSDSWIGFVEDKSEWGDTDIVFDITDRGGDTEVRFTHVGLRPDVECFDTCSVAWSAYLAGSLRDLITTGKGDPHRAGGDFDSETAKHEAFDKVAAGKATAG